MTGVRTWYKNTYVDGLVLFIFRWYRTQLIGQLITNQRDVLAINVRDMHKQEIPAFARSDEAMSLGAREKLTCATPDRSFLGTVARRLGTFSPRYQRAGHNEMRLLTRGTDRSGEFSRTSGRKSRTIYRNDTRTVSFTFFLIDFDMVRHVFYFMRR